jgi:tRNA(Ile)-lysidine synthetase-like protein
MIPEGWATMSSKFSQLKSLIEAKIQHFPLEKRRVVVACSGGVDSTALFWVFLELFQAKKIFSLELFHFNYGLRGEESEGDEAFCQGLADSGNIPFHCVRATPEDREARQGEGIQEWARRLRREALIQLALDERIVALAHHADDAAETVIMRAARGTSLAAMRGMAEWDGIWWRPWLRVAKSEILAAAEERSMLFREDSTNEKLDYARNVIRHKVLPELMRLYPAGRQKLLDLADDAHEVAQYALVVALDEVQFDPVTTACDRSALARLPDAVALSVLSHLTRSLCASMNAPHRQISRTNLLKVLGAARSEDTTKFVLEMSKGIFLEVAKSRVRSFPGPAQVLSN